MPREKVVRWKPVPAPSLANWPGLVKELSKGRLAALVVLTTMCGYALAPGAADLATMFWTTTGTALCVSSANTINQWLEVPFDAQMARTRQRALVRRACAPLDAFTFGITTGISGVGILWHCVNPTTAVLGAANILLYTAVYTPMKRRSIVNTWAGAIVGAIPPVMGWAACTGTIDPSALTLGLVLYAWQFPHFNSLSYLIRAEYAKAGYHMASVLRPSLNTASALRNSLLLLPTGVALPWLGVTTWWFAADVAAVNLLLCAGAWRFWQDPNNNTARKLFFGSLVYLPLFFGLSLLHKKDDAAEQPAAPAVVEAVE
ncbi:UbiA prenyltransferase family-domain-containing protein [Thamnocephalis sphaerospora]|uniref:Protoheme IX farnesyltransferase, mitochondrial n=1 Tax=Thamnocephalis sphaerospora TaxID=78915 RepID=A0A4P9XSG9_9FUNG|nr:UbiA prenyltransferase family-domain-containing protein [Thamnocephalis sphaerospora]|eukprot:RKP08481.1 UbiA prenyltransferase family-domain-containing protein [Thamnocephalis sphaerospora]